MALCDDILPSVLEGGRSTADSFPSVFGMLYCILPRPYYLADAFVTEKCYVEKCDMSLSASKLSGNYTFQIPFGSRVFLPVMAMYSQGLSAS
jgi:hypothetical protein